MTIHRETTARRRQRVRNAGRSFGTSGGGSTLLAVALLFGACASAPPGPPFKPAAPPPEHRARLYVYRLDERGSLATVHATLDGLEVGRFRDREYQTLEVPAGLHTLAASMRGFGLLAWGWNEHRFRLKPGETVYLKLSVRLTARSAPATSEIEIGGRPSGTASENVFIVPRSSAEGLTEIEVTSRLAGSASESN